MKTKTQDPTIVRLAKDVAQIEDQIQENHDKLKALADNLEAAKIHWQMAQDWYTKKSQPVIDAQVIAQMMLQQARDKVRQETYGQNLSQPCSAEEACSVNRSY